MEEDYKKKIIELLQKINNIKILKFIYDVANTGYKEEKAGS